MITRMYSVDRVLEETVTRKLFSRAQTSQHWLLSLMLHPALNKSIPLHAATKASFVMKQVHFLFFVRVVTLTEKRLAFVLLLAS